MSEKRKGKLYGYAGQSEDTGPRSLSLEHPDRIPTNVIKRPIKLPPMERIKQ